MRRNAWGRPAGVGVPDLAAAVAMRSPAPGPCLVRGAFSFVEIIVAFAVGTLFFGSLIYLASTTRVETSKAENYLRALQIGQETIELIRAMPVHELTPSNMQLFEGSLVDPQTGTSVALPIATTAAWQPRIRKYPDQYAKAFYYRKIRVETLAGSIPNARFMRRVTVDVLWNEGRAPERIEAIGATPDRMRKLSLGTLVFDEKEPY